MFYTESTQWDYSFYGKIYYTVSWYPIFCVPIKVKLCTCPPCNLHKHNLPFPKYSFNFLGASSILYFSIDTDVFLLVYMCFLLSNSPKYTDDKFIAGPITSSSLFTYFPKSFKRNQLSKSLNVQSEDNEDRASHLSNFISQKTSCYTWYMNMTKWYIFL